MPTLWWRSVGHTHTGYAVECFVDELLQAAGQDPVAGRLAMMGKAPRAAGVLRAVAELARWSGPGPPNGRARGVAVVESFGSFVAQIAEVSAGDGDGPRVHKVWCAVDCGVAVNPDVIRAQMEGGIGFGLGHALFAEVTLDEGRPVQAQLRHLPLAAHPRDAGGRGHDRALDREADRRRRAGRAADRAGGRQCAGAARPTAGRGGCRSCEGWSDAHALSRRGRLPRSASASRARRCGATQRSASAPPSARRDSCGRPRASPASPITRARSVALFEEAGKVLQHPRCVNCHPVGDRPRRPTACSRISRWWCAARTATARPGWPAATCHGDANFDPARVPGDPHWHLAPASMAWEGKIARPDLRAAQGPRAQRRPGHGRDPEAHRDDSLVGWGWSPAPAARRRPAPRPSSARC